VNDFALEIVALYLLVITGLLLIMMVTANHAEYSKGLWRALRQGRKQLPWWDDLSLNRPFLAIACTIVLTTATLALSAPGGASAAMAASGDSLGADPLAVATGVLVVAYFGLAYQYFLLRFAARGKIYFALFLFLAWLLPLVAGTILAMSMSGDRQAESQVVLSMSPIPGIGMLAAPVHDGTVRSAIQGPAITPALLFAFVFNSLLISARRRAYKVFLASTGTSHGTEPAPAAIDVAPNSAGIAPLVAGSEIPS
jgi:hypothetical protein